MFVKSVRKSSIVTLCLLIVCVIAGWMLLAWPNATAAGISRGLSVCSSIIIPSLFPFLVLSVFIVKSGLSVAIGRRLEWLTRFLFGLPGCCAAGIFIGLIGGYPAGGIAVGELVRQGTITRAQGKRMLMFCVNAGPAFVISAVGAGMLGSLSYGLLLYGAHIAASLILGILLRLSAGPPKEQPDDRTDAESRRAKVRLSPASAFVESVSAACRSLLVMCGFILLFAALLSLADGSGLSAFLHRLLTGLFSASSSPTLQDMLSCLFPCLLEVSCGSIEASHTGVAAPLLLGLTLGWGGLSVHCQIAAALHDVRLVDWRFFAARLFHALLGGAISVVLFRYAPVALNAYNSFGEAIIKPYTTSIAASIALLLLCSLFLLTVSAQSNTSVVKIRSKSAGKKEADML